MYPQGGHRPPPADRAFSLTAQAGGSGFREGNTGASRSWAPIYGGPWVLLRLKASPPIGCEPGSQRGEPSAFYFNPLREETPENQWRVGKSTAGRSRRQRLDGEAQLASKRTGSEGRPLRVSGRGCFVISAISVRPPFDQIGFRYHSLFQILRGI